MKSEDEPIENEETDSSTETVTASEIFSQLDLDQDGYISREELSEIIGDEIQLNQIWEILDQDKQGKIDLQNFQKR